MDLSDGDGDGDEVEDLDVMVAAQAPSDADAPVQAARRRLFAQARENVVSVDSESDFASLHVSTKLSGDVLVMKTPNTFPSTSEIKLPNTTYCRRLTEGSRSPPLARRP